MKRHLQWTEQQESPCNFAKYCACHTRWSSWLICVIYETSSTMRGASKAPLRTHQVLRLAGNSEFKIRARNLWIWSDSGAKKTIWPWSEHDPGIIRWIRRLSEQKVVSSRPPLRRPYSSDLGDDFLLKNATFPAPATSQNFTTCCERHGSHTPPSANHCACHENSHSTFTAYCACHVKCALLLFSTLFS